MKYELNRSYNGGGVVYLLKVRHLDQHDSTADWKLIHQWKQAQNNYDILHENKSRLDLY